MLRREKTTTTPLHIIKHIQNILPWLQTLFFPRFYWVINCPRQFSVFDKVGVFCCCFIVNGEQPFRNEWEKTRTPLCVKRCVLATLLDTGTGRQPEYIHHTRMLPPHDYTLLCGWFIFRVLTIHTRRQRRDKYYSRYDGFECFWSVVVDLRSTTTRPVLYHYTTAYEESNHAKRNIDEIYYINIIVSDCVTRGVVLKEIRKTKNCTASDMRFTLDLSMRFR